MDIQGNDVVFHTGMSVPAQKRMMLSYLRNMYPDGVWEDDEDGFMFYLSVEAKADWDGNGRTDENASKMIHVICNEGELTVVHEGEIDAEEIGKMLRANWVF